MTTQNMLDVGLSGSTGSVHFVGSTSPSITTPSITTALNDANGNTMLGFTPAGSAVNYIQVNNSDSGGAVSLNAAGTDTNVQLNLVSKGGSPIGFYAGNNVAGAFIPVASAVNYLEFYNSIANAPLFIRAEGTDSNIRLDLQSKGSQGIVLWNNQGSNVLADFIPATSSVNYVTFTASATNNPPIIAAAGNDSAINLNLSGKGTTGTVQFGNGGSFSANSNVATVLGVVGPAGSHTTVQTWLTIVDSGGTTRYIPCF